MANVIVDNVVVADIVAANVVEANVVDVSVNRGAAADVAALTVVVGDEADTGLGAERSFKIF